LLRDAPLRRSVLIIGVEIRGRGVPEKIALKKLIASYFC
jgi:hypothetical protein